MKVIITGALGYIGSRLIRSAWPSHVDELILIDNLSTQAQSALFDFSAAVPCRFIEGDIRTVDFDPLMARGDVVVHLAAITGSEATLGDRRVVDEVNVAATARIAHACAHREARLLFLSSTSVYGGFDGAVDEAAPTETVPTENYYAGSKLRAEQLIDRVDAPVPLRYAIARCGTVYGPSPGMRFHTAISKFCWQAATGQPLTVWRTARDQSRPYLDIDDAIAAMHFLIARDLFDRRTFNVVTDTATVRDVAAHIREIVPDLRLVDVDSPVMSSRSQTVSCARIAAEGFRFRGGLRDGIRRTLAVLDGVSAARLANDRR
jgi:nucleoside-diphosphate-sugar epimerase